MEVMKKFWTKILLALSNFNTLLVSALVYVLFLIIFKVLGEPKCLIIVGNILFFALLFIIFAFLFFWIYAIFKAIADMDNNGDLC